MRRLIANKTQFYRLVAEFEPLPPMRRVKFIRSCRRSSYWLSWEAQNGMFCEAFYATCGGRPVLLVKERESSGKVITRVTHNLDVDDLTRRGMVEEYNDVRGL